MVVKFLERSSMKKFILILLLILLFAGALTVFLGFYNARQIRSYVQAAREIRSEYDLGSPIKEMEEKYKSLGGQDDLSFQEESKKFADELKNISQKAESAKKEIVNLKTPRVGKVSKDLLADYYSKVHQEAENLNHLVQFMNQLFGVAVVFSKIEGESSLEGMKTLISEAKVKSREINPENLPAELDDKGGELKESMDGFLSVMEKIIDNPAEETTELDSAYEDFSKKQEEFFKASKNYLESLEDFSPLKEKIEEELSMLEKIYFKVW